MCRVGRAGPNPPLASPDPSPVLVASEALNEGFFLLQRHICLGIMKQETNDMI